MLEHPFDGLSKSTQDLRGKGVALFARAHVLAFSNSAFAKLRRYPNDLCRPGETMGAVLRFDADRGDRGLSDPPRSKAGVASCADCKVEHPLADEHILAIRCQCTEDVRTRSKIQERTEECQAERMRQQSEERQTLVTRANSRGICDRGVAVDMLYVSDKRTAFLDIDVNSGLLRAWIDQAHPKDKDAFIAGTDAVATEINSVY